jgi:hypothetical protein
MADPAARGAGSENAASLINIDLLEGDNPSTARCVEAFLRLSGRGGMNFGEEVKRAVLDAFDAARKGGRPSWECYRAGVMAWRQIFPDHQHEFAARRAVAVILEAKEPTLRHHLSRAPEAQRSTSLET